VHQNKKKGAQAGDPKHRKQERQKEKSIRLDDLIPKQNIRGAHRFFGATDTQQPTQKDKGIICLRKKRRIERQKTKQAQRCKTSLQRKTPRAAGDRISRPRSRALTPPAGTDDRNDRRNRPNNQPKIQRNSMPEKKETTRTTKKKTGAKVQDLAPKKDAKGGGISSNHRAPQVRPDGFSARG
jgi:hypothetical protein